MNARLFSDKHVWILRDGENATIGITDYAQERLGNIMFLNLPDEGETVETGQSFGDIESIKTISELYSPADGVVLRINEELVEEPDVINENPYESWLIEIKVSSVPDNLMDEETYLKMKEEL